MLRDMRTAPTDGYHAPALIPREWLQLPLINGDKAPVGNTGYRRYLKTISDDHFAIDPNKIEEDKRFDGVFVLRTNINLNPSM
jgi:hypothetical protein